MDPRSHLLYHADQMSAQSYERLHSVSWLAMRNDFEVSVPHGGSMTQGMKWLVCRCIA